MTEALTLLQSFFREAWGALAGVMLAFALLAMLVQILRISSGALTGANFWVWEGVAGVSGIFILVLFAFLGVPQIVKAATASLPSGGGCGPVGELGTLSSGLIGGLAALRMFKALLSSLASAAIGAGGGMSQALIECGEALLGMLLAALAMPLAGWFLGAC